MAEPHDNSIATVVRILMVLSGVSQDELMTPMGCSQPTVSRRMGEKAGWTARELSGLAEFFDVPMSVFFMSPEEVRQRLGAVSERKPDFTSPYVEQQRLFSHAA
jgi:hypothetical protein